MTINLNKQFKANILVDFLTKIMKKTNIITIEKPKIKVQWDQIGGLKMKIAFSTLKLCKN